MLLRRTWPLLLTALLFLAWFSSRWTLAGEPAVARSVRETLLNGKSPLSLGNSSCSASNCHGGIEPTSNRRIRGDEYTVWLRSDPHSDAYAALSNSLGKQIAERLKIGDAREAKECLACHAGPGFVNRKDLPNRQQLLAEGVGCEACHGPAEKWLAGHSRPEPWHKKDVPGMTPIMTIDPKDNAGHSVPYLSARAEVCAGCHVGGDGRDMNHDMIAAGHPRLNFEYTAYLANMPPHWRKVTPPDAKSWVIGRVASARAAEQLLMYRSGPATPAPWPEFAEHDCFACHHDLVDSSFRQSRTAGPRGRRPGSFLPNDWYTAWLPEGLAGLPEKEAGDVRQQVNELQTLLSTSAPNKAKVHTAATEMTRTLHNLFGKLERWSPTEQDAQAARDILAKTLKKDNEATWDETAQLYFALVALNHSKPDATSDELLKQLRFPAGYDSPRGKFPPFPAKP